MKRNISLGIRRSFHEVLLHNLPVAHLLTGRSVVTEAHDRSARAMKWLVIDAVKGVEKDMASHSVS